MSLFVVTFRVQDGPRYDDRYGSLTASIEDAAHHAYWDEPTSFYLLESELNSEALRKQIVSNADINSDDLVVVINISLTKGHSATGLQDPARFKAFMDSR